VHDLTDLTLALAGYGYERTRIGVNTYDDVGHWLALPFKFAARTIERTFALVNSRKNEETCCCKRYRPVTGPLEHEPICPMAPEGDEARRLLRHRQVKSGGIAVRRVGVQTGLLDFQFQPARRPTTSRQVECRSISSWRRAAAARCRARLDGIPLAIELAAAKVKALTPAQIVTRLDNRFQLLIGGSRTARPRQQTLHATLTWSYELLEVNDRGSFDQLAIFSGGWDLEAAELVCTESVLARDDVLNGLLRLVDKSLVLADRGRYRMLETIRQYAVERLRDRNAVDAQRERHAHHYLRVAQFAEPEVKRAGQAAWLERLAIEHDNLRTALRSSIDVGRPEVGLRLAIALARFWEIRGHFGEGRRWFAELLSMPDSAQLGVSLRAAAVARAGYLAYLQGDVAAALQMLDEGLRMARRANALDTVAFALFGLGQMSMMRRDFVTARPFLNESLALGRQLNDAWATARALSWVGTLAREEGDIEMARALLEEGLAIARQAGERRIESSLEISLAMIAYITNDLTTAAVLLEDSLVTKRELGDRYQTAMARRTFGWVAFDRGDYVSACEQFLEALAIVRDLGTLEATPRALTGLACVAVQRGQMDIAVHLFAAEARISEYASMQAPSFLGERHKRFQEVAQLALGIQAEIAWREGLALGPEQIWAEAATVAQAAADARS
jgi:predicted ATPase